MTLIEKYKDNQKMLDFIIKSYPQCHCIDDIEGKILDGEYSGYSFKEKYSGKEYFVEEGIRGFTSGTFIIEDGFPRNITKPLTDDQIVHIGKILELVYLRNGQVIPDFIKKMFSEYYESDLQDLWKLKSMNIWQECIELRHKLNK